MFDFSALTGMLDQPATWVALFALALALAFDFVNGFHDTANACATVIYTKALGPRTAIIMSGVLNFAGAMIVGTAVAVVITKIVTPSVASLHLVVAVLIGSLIWNVLTWWKALPVSSSHCLIGALFGAGIAAAGTDGVTWNELAKVLIALFISPAAGFVISNVVTWIATRLSGEHHDVEATGTRKQVLRWMQVASSASVSFSHGANDGQKTMGIMSLILGTQFASLGFVSGQIPWFVAFAAALALGLGTMIGGWRVIQTVGGKLTIGGITRSQGFAAEASTAAIIFTAAHFGAPISTTHVLTSSVAGGAIAAKGLNSLNLALLGKIGVAWLLTLPAAAALAASAYYLIGLFV
jgi:PiT family inorganic phosphate transporter